MKIAFVPLAGSTMLTVSFVLGCGGDSKPFGTTGTPPTPSSTAAPKHAAHGTGPHEGAVADWGGGKYHVEFTVDHDKQEATVYVLGSDEKTAAPIKAKDGKLLLSIAQPAFQVELIAAPEAGESGGVASKYVGKHEKLGIVQEFAGSISGEAEGTPYVGEFKEEPHP
ncbi:MAG: hypothetical protein JNM18_00950 [Planctomycetaceae bacterium]|nr:hypothetical protein [Planctomycetaceae bacterium]